MSEFEPIGVFYALEEDKYLLPSQPDEDYQNLGKIVLNSGCNFEQALDGLDGFDRVWILFEFDRATNWKPKVMPPRGGIKRGVFATRSPHRPNPIGMSCVKILGVRGLEIYVASHDLLNLTPVLDIKPYIDYADSFVSQKQGWLGDLPDGKSYNVNWSIGAERQELYLKKKWGVTLRENVQRYLQRNPFPYPSNRIKRVSFDSQKFEFAYKSWRIQFSVDTEDSRVNVLEIRSGYDKATLNGEKDSKWNDVPMHKNYVDQFKKVSLEI